MTITLEYRLAEALDDEYKARATYHAVVEKFGPVRPFVNILASEQRHVSALLSLYEAYQLPIPGDPWPARIAAPQTVAAACEAAVAGERENLSLYDRLLAATPEPDVQRVLMRLRAASRDRHLPAFERCLQRSSGAMGSAGPRLRRGAKRGGCGGVGSGRG